MVKSTGSSPVNVFSPKSFYVAVDFLRDRSRTGQNYHITKHPRMDRKSPKPSMTQPRTVIMSRRRKTRVTPVMRRPVVFLLLVKQAQFFLYSHYPSRTVILQSLTYLGPTYTDSLRLHEDSIFTNYSGTNSNIYSESTTPMTSMYLVLEVFPPCAVESSIFFPNVYLCLMGG